MPQVQAPEVCLTIKYADGTLSVWVAHVRNIQAPAGVAFVDPYVKCYLIPDPNKVFIWSQRSLSHLI